MKRYSMETTVGIFVVIGILCVGFMAVKLGKIPVFEENTYLLHARFASVSGLKVGSPVEMFGIQVGKIAKLEIDFKREMALVHLQIRNGIPVYDDGSAAIKTAGLIGDKFVKLDPGGAGNLLKPDGTITETTSSPDLEDLIGSLAFGQINKGLPENKEKKK
jgi:phospholipid/cholesterol/gamma-HCH transport system substrate-binding protein